MFQCKHHPYAIIYGKHGELVSSGELDLAGIAVGLGLGVADRAKIEVKGLKIAWGQHIKTAPPLLPLGGLSPARKWDHLISQDPGLAKRLPRYS